MNLAGCTKEACKFRDEYSGDTNFSDQIPRPYQLS